MKSKYADTYRFFDMKIQDFLNEYPMYYAYLPIRILNNCILLPIEAESQDTALRIFSTLNDRGKPLADTDIFKAQLYKYYSLKGEKDDFIGRWKELERICDSIFTSQSGSPMDELFTRYMYFLRAKQGIKSTSVEALRKFYERDAYKLLKNENVLSDLEMLADFWNSIEEQSEIYSERVLKNLFVLKYAPNGMWAYMLSAYFMTNKDENNQLSEESLFNFLTKMIAYIWAYAVIRPGVIALRTPVFPEMIKIVNGNDLSFENYKLDKNELINALNNYAFTNGRPMTRSMLAWWMYQKDNQELMDIKQSLEIEHIFARKRQEHEKTLSDRNNLEKIGNKIFLEESINIRASDYRFEDKIKYYNGFITDLGKVKKGTNNAELIDLAKTNTDYTEQDILNRTKLIIQSFVNFVESNNLLK